VFKRCSLVHKLAVAPPDSGCSSIKYDLKMTMLSSHTLSETTISKWNYNHIYRRDSICNTKRLCFQEFRMAGSLTLWTRRDYFNSLHGTLPISIRMVDMTNNIISGEIPPELGYLSSLKLTNNHSPLPLPGIDVDFSYNNLKGPIPDGFPASSLIGNKDVCSDNWYIQTGLKFQPCPAHDHIVLGNLLVIVLPVLISLIMAFLLCLRHIFLETKNKDTKATATTKNGDLFSIWNYDGSIAYEDIIRAIEDFDMKYCIGTGAYGSVYKAQLPSGKVVAVKKLHGFEAEVPAFDESFRNEVKVLSEIKHRHIVKLHGFCLHKRIMFLVYEYMEKGSLFSVLFDDVEAMELDWKKRVNIVKGTAHALSYLHHDCTLPIVLRDISASNILINSEWQPSVGDFGTARFLSLDSSNRTIVAGTIGYIAPGKLFISFFLVLLFLVPFPFYLCSLVHDLMQIVPNQYI